MPTLVLDPQPRESAELIARRRRLGQDLFDEVWEGVLHMNPAPPGAHGAIETQLTMVLGPLATSAGLVLTAQYNVGDSERDYRVPDPGRLRRPGGRGGADRRPGERGVSWPGLEPGAYKQLERSRLIELGAAELAAQIDWP
jgi:hypothetical protein